jgi:hypothetical protein
MTGYRLFIDGEAWRTLDFAVERLRDGAMHHPGDAAWHKPSRGWAAFARMGQPSPGHYEAALPPLDADQDYCVHVVDVHTGQLVMSQLIDGGARKIKSPKVEAEGGRPAPRNEYHGGFVVAIRAGRHVELE